MKIFQRIWNDIQRGGNIDLYLTVVVAIGLVVLNLVGVASQTLVAPLTLAVLGLLAISNLGNRYKIEELIEKLSQTSHTVFIEEFPPNFKSDIEGATELWLVGVSLTQITRKYHSTVEQMLRSGHRVKVLVIHPKGSAIEMAESRAYGQPNVERARHEILGTLDDYCQLRSISPDQLEIRTIQTPLGHSLIAVNPNSSSGIFYIANYPFKTPGGSKPKFVLRTKDGNWFDFFKEEFHALWESGTEWQPKGEN